MSRSSTSSSSSSSSSPPVVSANVSAPGANGANGANAASSSSSSSPPVANAGSQYALCALGVGLVALGIVMIVWSVVPVDGESGRPTVGDAGKTSSVAFILVGAGVTMLLLSLCLGIRNKSRRAQHAQQGGPGPYTTQLSMDDSIDVHQGGTGPYTTQLSMDDSIDVVENRFTVPSYDEVVGSSGATVPPVAGRGVRMNSTSQLPSYDDVFDGDVPPVTPTEPGVAVPAGSTGGRWKSGAARKLLPLKLRRIKSEKLGVKSAPSSPQPVVLSIEPLTPPPQYDDKPPQL
ncbi:transmembrane protein 51-like [Engraulis encrasicolus]|uniref:transmembrane protein 51-like n=1 Tax=Engraulis encrasicolus TaxID=184585 RepID=UPI002FD0CB2C